VTGSVLAVAGGPVTGVGGSRAVIQTAHAMGATEVSVTFRARAVVAAARAVLRGVLATELPGADGGTPGFAAGARARRATGWASKVDARVRAAHVSAWRRAGRAPRPTLMLRPQLL
jgi:hypothetical protein